MDILRRTFSGAVALAETRVGAIAVFGVALATWWIQAIAMPLIGGRDFGTYLGAFVELFQSDPIDLGYVLGRTPIASLVTGGLLVPFDGALAEPVMSLLYAASILAWFLVARTFAGAADSSLPCCSSCTQLRDPFPRAGVGLRLRSWIRRLVVARGSRAHETEHEGLRIPRFGSGGSRPHPPGEPGAHPSRSVGARGRRPVARTAALGGRIRRACHCRHRRVDASQRPSLRRLHARRGGKAYSSTARTWWTDRSARQRAGVARRRPRGRAGSLRTSPIARTGSARPLLRCSFSSDARRSRLAGEPTLGMAHRPGDLARRRLRGDPHASADVRPRSREIVRRDAAAAPLPFPRLGWWSAGRERCRGRIG